MPPVYAHQIFSMYGTFFKYDSHFAFFLYLPLLPTWVEVELSYLAQLYICSGVTHTDRILYLQPIFLNLHFFFKSHFALFELTGIGCSEIAITFLGLFGIYDKQPMLP